ncbi:hypothetical protein BELL_1246g00010 [Botrytis elliptica]|uniref:Uncharacterized protein n=1 Tax=Botrytis elliptica TaxID=278938 RepID=A0A4Z1IRS9_9HELO|nr:hypothetical protein EAE99_009965 [Botrytis elliptica]TGO59417.1 hypothetical protein BELL_1246g00010 [Botrytis elliptica]
MNSLEDEMELIRNNPLYKEPFEAHDYDFFLPDLDSLNTALIGIQKKYEALEGEHSKNVVAILRHLIRDVKTLSHDKILQKVCCVLLKEKYEELKAAEEAARQSDVEIRRKKDILSNKEDELSQRIKNVSVGSDVRRAFDDLFKKFQQVSVSNRQVTEEVIKSNTESLNTFKESSNKSLNDVVESLKTSINDVAESSKSSIDDATESSKKSINELVDSSKASINELAESSKNSMNELAESSKNSVSALANSSNSSLNDVVESSKTSIDEIVQSSKNSMNDLAKSSESSIDNVVKSSTNSMEQLFNSSKKSLDETVEQAKKSIENSKTSIQEGVENIEESIRSTNSVIHEGVKSVTDASTTLVNSIDKVKTSLEEKTKASIDEFVTSAKATISDNVKSSNDEFLTSVKEAIGKAIKTGRASAGKERKIVDQADEIERLLNLVKSQETMISTLSSENHNLKRASDTLLKEKNSTQVQLDEEKNNFSRVTGEKDNLEAEKTTLQAEKALLDTQISTLQNDNKSLREQVSTLTREKSNVEKEVSTLKTRLSEWQNNARTSNLKITALEKSVSNRDLAIKTLENTIIPRDTLSKQLLEKTEMIQQLQKIDYDQMSKGQEAFDETCRRRNNEHLDQLRKSHKTQLAGVEESYRKHFAEYQNYHNELVQKYLNVAKVPVAPCPSCAQHEEKIDSFKRDLLAKDSEIKTLQDQVGTIKDAVTSQTELIELQRILNEDIKSFKKKKEVREKALASMTEDRDKWRNKNRQLSSQHTEELEKLRLELGKPTLELENKVRELDLAAEKLKKDNEKSHNSLINSHGSQMKSKDEEIEKLKSELDSLKKMKPASPISPTATDTSPIRDGSASKKRKNEVYSGSPSSKLVRTWRNYVSEASSIAEGLIPESFSNVNFALSELLACFYSDEAIRVFKEFEKTNNDVWYCLGALLEDGIARSKEIDDDTCTCTACLPSAPADCVQVKSFGSVVTFRVVNTSKM